MRLVRFTVSITSTLVHIRVAVNSAWHPAVNPSTPASPVKVAAVKPMSWNCGVS